jgi:rod shape-determining protein MreC
MPAIHNQRPPAFFVRGPSPFARLTFFAALSLALMAVDARLHYLTEVRQGFTVLLHPLEVIAHSPIVAYDATRDFLTRQNLLVEDNDALRQKNLKQAADLQRFNALQAENDHLRDLLKAARQTPQPGKLAEIIHVSRDPFTQKVIVNLGTQQGIMAGQAAIDEYGVIGQVTQVYPFSSEVTLVTDKDLAIPVQIERNGLRAIAFGYGRDSTIDLPYLPMNVDIHEGDKLVTSGIDGVYPSGLAVAKVSRIERNADSPFAHIVCTPLAGIDSHRQILLLTMVNVPPAPTEDTKPVINKSRHASRRH